MWHLVTKFFDKFSFLYPENGKQQASLVYQSKWRHIRIESNIHSNTHSNVHSNIPLINISSLNSADRRAPAKVSNYDLRNMN
jgi:hypothetical protein